MWIQVRSMDGRTSSRVDGLSKLTRIEDLRERLVDAFRAPVSRQRLFYRGKQLEDGHTLFDYDVGLNDIVQILIRQESPSKCPPSPSFSSSTDKENKPSAAATDKAPAPSVKTASKYFQVGDLVDAKDVTTGAWFEAKVVDILQGEKQTLQASLSNGEETQGTTDGLVYSVVFEDYEECEGPVSVDLEALRPRARRLVPFAEVKEGDVVMVNYNVEEPKERGFWYDCTVAGKKSSRTRKELVGSIRMGPDEVRLDNCRIVFTEEIFAIEKNVESASEHSETKDQEQPPLRTKKPRCSSCGDAPGRKCKVCSCSVCGGKDEPGSQILCDECDLAFHLWCLRPPLEEIPQEDEWYCPECKNDATEVVRAGERLRASRKKSRMASASSASSRDWGRGMACVGRTRECTLVPPNHFGPVPGVEVGTLWKFRVQVSEAGVHRPHVAGIHGREGDGAFSIVLSGGYEDDVDEGEEFTYTGSGGRDLSGNKRCAEQSCDQTLTRMNRALASNCNAPLSTKGAEAKNWREGKPVRVVRNCKGRKHSEFCPEEGNRYDGIYKVVRYWPERGKAGFLVWRYLLRRDDPSPAPWTKEGRRRTHVMQYPEGYLESLAEKEKGEAGDKKTTKKKRESTADGAEEGPRKKIKSTYAVPSEAREFIQKDSANEKLWAECLQCVEEGSQAFLKKVEDSFSCVCCQELVHRPITTVCSHNICKSCLERSFRAEVFGCPMCRRELEKGATENLNRALQGALLLLFPGYDAAR